MIQPLKIKIQENLRSEIALVLEGRRELFLGSEKPVLSNDVLTVDPMDSVILISVLNVSAKNEMFVFGLRREVLSEIEQRMARSSKDSTKIAYSQILEHARSTFPPGSMTVAEPAEVRRPTLQSQPPQLRLV